MKKFLEAFWFELALFAVGTVAVLAVAYMKWARHHDFSVEFEIGLATAVAPVPLALARLESR